MNLQRSEIADFGPSPAEVFQVYPGATPAGSFIYAGGAVWALPEDDTWEAMDDWVSRFHYTRLADRIPVLAHGSNANPAQIHRKLHDRCADDDCVPMVLGCVQGLAPVYAAHLSTYGALPAALDLVDDRTRSMYLALYTEKQLDCIMQTEAHNYRLQESAGEVIRSFGRHIHCFYAFIARWGVLKLAGQRLLLDEWAQEDALNYLFTHLSQTGEVPPYDRYRDDPLGHRAVVQAAMQNSGVRVPHRINWSELATLSQARPLAAVPAAAAVS